MKKLAIITTHPIQYYAPVFRLLHQRGEIELRVFYTWGEMDGGKHDPGFGKSIEWDLPLLEGYRYEWVKNTAADPGSHHYKGIKNPELLNQISNWKPDALLVFGWAYHSHLKAMRYFHNRLPVYFRGDSTLLDETGIFRSLIKNHFLTWVYKHVDGAFYAGTQNKAYFKKYGLKEEQLIFAPHAVDNLRFAEDRREEALNLRNKLKISEDELLVLFAGKFESKKNPKLLLQAFIMLNNPHIHLLFAGNGVLETTLTSLRRSPFGQISPKKPILTNLKSQNIHFMDFQNQTQMPVIYQACDLFCLPSKGPGETWGLAVNEAMACAKAVLISDQVGCSSDLVKPFINGRIFKSGNVTDLKEKLVELTSDKSVLKEMGQKSKEIIHDFNFERIVSAIEKQVLLFKN